MLVLDEITKRRAYVIFELLKEELMEGNGTEIQAEAFRFSFLILRGSYAFLNTFGLGNLFLDYDKISEIYFAFRCDLPGVRGLSDEEEQLISIHNGEVAELERGINVSSCLS